MGKPWSTPLTGKRKSFLRLSSQETGRKTLLKQKKLTDKSQQKQKTLTHNKNRDVRFLNSVTMEPMPLFYCLGRHGPLRSLSFDSLHSSLLHVGTEQGEILVFDTSPPSSRQQRPQPLNKQQPHYHQRLVHVDQDGGHCLFIKKLASRSGTSFFFIKKIICVCGVSPPPSNL